MARRQLGSGGSMRRPGGSATISEEDTSRHAHRLELSAAVRAYAAGRRRIASAHNTAHGD